MYKLNFLAISELYLVCCYTNLTQNRKYNTLTKAQLHSSEPSIFPASAPNALIEEENFCASVLVVKHNG